MSHYPKFDDTENPTAPSSSRKWSITPLGARILTLVSLVVSIVIMKTNRISFSEGSVEFSVGFGTVVHTYKYVFYSMVVGFGYTLVQIPLAIYFIKSRLPEHLLFSYFEFYGDKVCGFLLATALGAVYGVTIEMKKAADKGFEGNTKSKYDDFFNLCYVSAGFLLIAFIASAVSSIKSSLALAITLS